jgi:hypothetical protein
MRSKKKVASVLVKPARPSPTCNCVRKMGKKIKRKEGKTKRKRKRKRKSKKKCSKEEGGKQVSIWIHVGEKSDAC